MSPEAGKIAERLRQNILQDQGATDADVGAAKDEWEKAAAAGNIEETTRIGALLLPKRETNKEVSRAITALVETLESLGISKIDIPLAALDDQPAFILPSSLEETEIPRRAPRRKKEIWIDDAEPLIIQRIILKKRGRFVFATQTEVGLSVMSSQSRNKESAAKAASNRAGVAKQHFVERLIAARDEIKKESHQIPSNMQELIEASIELANLRKGISLKKGENPLDKMEDDAWKQVYIIIVKDYGKMSLEEFATKVLFRFPSSRFPGELLKKLGKLEVSKEEFLGNEVAEIILCNAFMREEVRPKVASKILDDTGSETLKREFGSYLSHLPDESFLASRKRASGERKNKSIGPQEHQRAIDQIKAVIKNVAIRNWVWKEVFATEKRFAVRLFYRILTLYPQKAEKLRDILFPETIVKAAPDYLVVDRKKK